MIKGSMKQEDTIVDVNASRTRASSYLKLLLMTLEENTDSYIIIMRDFETRLSTKDR